MEDDLKNVAPNIQKQSLKNVALLGAIGIGVISAIGAGVYFWKIWDPAGSLSHQNDPVTVSTTTKLGTPLSEDLDSPVEVKKEGSVNACENPSTFGKDIPFQAGKSLLQFDSYGHHYVSGEVGKQPVVDGRLQKYFRNNRYMVLTCHGDLFYAGTEAQDSQVKNSFLVVKGEKSSRDFSRGIEEIVVSDDGSAYGAIGSDDQGFIYITHQGEKGPYRLVMSPQVTRNGKALGAIVSEQGLRQLLINGDIVNDTQGVLSYYLSPSGRHFCALLGPENEDSLYGRPTRMNCDGVIHEIAMSTVWTLQWNEDESVVAFTVGLENTDRQEVDMTLYRDFIPVDHWTVPVKSTSEYPGEYPFSNAGISGFSSLVLFDDESNLWYVRSVGSEDEIVYRGAAKKTGGRIAWVSQSTNRKYFVALVAVAPRKYQILFDEKIYTIPPDEKINPFHCVLALSSGKFIYLSSNYEIGEYSENGQRDPSMKKVILHKKDGTVEKNGMIYSFLDFPEDFSYMRFNPVFQLRETPDKSAVEFFTVEVFRDGQATITRRSIPL